VNLRQSMQILFMLVFCAAYACHLGVMAFDSYGRGWFDLAALSGVACAVFAICFVAFLVLLIMSQLIRNQDEPQQPQTLEEALRR